MSDIDKLVEYTRKILKILKTSEFTKEELFFLKELYIRIVDSTDKLLEKGEKL